MRACSGGTAIAVTSAVLVLPFDGFRFAYGLGGGGALVTSWANLPPVQGASPLCPVVDDGVDGTGGLMLKNRLSVLRMSVKPEVSSVRQGRRTTVTA